MLVTRPEPGASHTAARLIAGGFKPVVAPFLTVRPGHARLPDAARLQAVVVASGNAVALPAAYHRLPLLAVGDSTAARARAAGFGDVHSAGGTAADLAALAGCLLRPERGPVMLAAGFGQGTRLARALRRQGLVVQRRAVYAAAGLRAFPDAAAAAIASGLYAGLFFSAATARAFVRLLPSCLRPRLQETAAIAIGAAAAGVLSALPWCDIRVAAQPTQEGILALL